MQQKVDQIPAYEDTGVKFQGKYKTQISGNAYELKGQQKIMRALQFTNALSSSNFPLNIKKKFILTGLLIQWDIAAKKPTEYFYLADYDGSSYKLTKNFQFYFGIQASGSLFFDFSSSPIEFNNGIGWGLGLFPSLNAGDYCNYCFFGFEEQI